MKRNVFAAVVPLIFSLMVGVNASAQQRNHLTKKVLFVVTSHSKLGNTGKSTGLPQRGGASVGGAHRGGLYGRLCKS
ncbi:hypothetical protein SAMN05444369_1196 [Capnocytophaga haemolytica]|uniref:Uncharacterized protein n=1 Tax=Capnocytophaga haemolytica TaxID=45243 RepID=A0AAX2H0R9_9FLAO|nr:hypothetical protein SAMN05444369_1196 [Capnocytophaga haemolytica]SNV11835.1 Uncharacterised protein [Capnocytophaga haemolytica]